MMCCAVVGGEEKILPVARLKYHSLIKREKKRGNIFFFQRNFIHRHNFFLKRGYECVYVLMISSYIQAFV